MFSGRTCPLLTWEITTLFSMMADILSIRTKQANVHLAINSSADPCFCERCEIRSWSLTIPPIVILCLIECQQSKGQHKVHDSSVIDLFQSKISSLNFRTFFVNFQYFTPFISIDAQCHSCLVHFYCTKMTAK